MADPLKLVMLGWDGQPDPELNRLLARGPAGLWLTGKVLESPRSVRSALAPLPPADPPLLIAAGGVPELEAWPQPPPQPGTLGFSYAEDGELIELQLEVMAFGRGLSEAGINLWRGPSLDLGAGDLNRFSNEVDMVALLGRTYCEALQATGVLACPFAFPGEDALERGLAGPPNVLLTKDAAPFMSAAASGVEIFELSHKPLLHSQDRPAALCPELIDWLRDDLDFRGLISAGDLAALATATDRDLGEVAAAAVEAGCELLWLRDSNGAEEVAEALAAPHLVRRVAAAARRNEVMRRAWLGP